MDNAHNDSNYDFDFDTCMTTGQIGMMKGILPFVDMPIQQYLAIYIKILELQYVISFFKKNEHGISAPVCDSDSGFLSILQNVRKYSSSKDSEMIDQLLQMAKAFKMYQNYSEVLKPFMDAMQMPSEEDTCSETDVDDNHEQYASQGRNNAMFTKLQNLLSPEQQAMFETFMNNNEVNEHGKEDIYDK